MRRSEPDRLPVELAVFLSDLVHDLRNILDGLGMSLGQDLTRPDERMREVTFRNVYDVMRKTEDFLDRARAPRRAEGSADVLPNVERATSHLAPFLRQRRVTSDSADGTTVAVDSRILRTLLENILHVLAKRTSEGDTIRLSSERNEQVHISFDVPEIGTNTSRDVLFSRDFRAGLDLWVARETARANGGDLEFRANDGGLRLVLSLPWAGPSAESKRGAVTKRRVLVVDDNVDSAKSLSILLSSAGFEAISKQDGVSALEAVRAFEPDAVLLDLGLPGMDGYEVCRRIRREPGGARLLLLAVSGRGDDETLAAVRDAGFDAHCLKPVDHKELLRRLVG